MIANQKENVNKSFSSSPLNRLCPEHYQDLKGVSGLSDETIRAADIYSVPPRDIDRIVGPKLASHITSLLAFPYNHGSTFTRYKLFPTFRDGLGHTIKYFQGKNSSPSLYLPPEPRDLDRVGESLWILEGEKKTLRWWQEKFGCSIGIGGAWNWSDSHFLYPKLIPDFDKISLKGRKTNVVLDSDYTTNTNVRLGYLKFANALLQKGAEVYFIVIPSGEDGAKAGLDDFLKGHTAKQVLRLPRTEVTLAYLRTFEKEFPHLAFMNDFLRDVQDGMDPDKVPNGDIPPETGDVREIPMVKRVLEFYGQPTHNCQFFKKKTDMYIQGDNAWYGGGHPEHSKTCPACVLEDARKYLTDLAHNFHGIFYYILIPKNESHDALRTKILRHCEKEGIPKVAAKLVSNRNKKKAIFSPILIDPRMRPVTWESPELEELLKEFLAPEESWKKGEHKFDGFGDFELAYHQKVHERKKRNGIIHLQFKSSEEEVTKSLEGLGEKPVKNRDGFFNLKLSPSTKDLIRRIVTDDRSKIIPSTSVWSEVKVMNDGGFKGG